LLNKFNKITNIFSSTMKNPLVTCYALVWIAYWASCLAVPANSLYEETHMQAVSLVAIYVLLSIAIALLLMKIAPESRYDESPDRLNLLYDYLKPHRLIVLASSLMVLGLVLHFYDKIVIMDIDYSVGIANARHEWLSNGAKRGGGISSWQSATGHILANFYFIVMLTVLLFWEELSKKEQFLGFALSTVVLLTYSASMGSRTVPLFFSIYVISIMLLRKPLGKKTSPLLLRLSLFILIFLVFTYNIFVFQKRSEVFGDNSPKDYTQSFFNHLGGEKTSYYEVGEHLPKPLKGLFYHIVLTFVYVNHNQWTFDYILTLDNRPGQSTLNTFYAGLTKVGIIDNSQLEQRAFSGKFLALPGCAYYDYGTLGVISISIIHGIFLFFANHLVRKKNLRLWHLFLFILVCMFSLLSPLSSAANLMSFPYIIISFLCLPLLAQVVKLRSINLPKANS